MKTDKGNPEADLFTLAEAQRIRMDEARSAKPSDKDKEILAEAERIRNNEDRAAAAREHRLGKKKKSRDADVFAGAGSFAGKLKARREAIESGDLEGASQVFIQE